MINQTCENENKLMSLETIDNCSQIPFDEYRIIRKKVYSDHMPYITRPYSHHDEEPSNYSFREKRRFVKATKDSLISEITKKKIGHTYTLFCSRFLRIPIGLFQPKPLWVYVAQTLCIFVPSQILIQGYKFLSKRYVNYESRKYLFSKYFHLSIGSLNAKFTASLDFAISNFSYGLNEPDIEKMSIKSFELVKCLHSLGVRNWFEVIRISDKFNHIDKHILELLMSENLIQQTNELGWINHARNHFQQDNSLNYNELYKTIKLMNQFKVARETIADICNIDHARYNSERLNTTLNLLNADHDISSIVATLRELVWKADPAKWQFIVDRVGLITTDDIEMFSPFLTSSCGICNDFVDVLKVSGASIDDIILNLDNIVEVGLLTQREHCIQAIELLIQKYNFSPSNLPAAKAFILNDKNLSDWLSVLEKYEITEPSKICHFSVCYPSVNVLDFDTLLGIAIPRARIDQLEEVSRWIQKAAQLGYYSTYHYITDNVEIKTLSELKGMLRICRVSITILEYMIFKCRKRTIKDLLEWFAPHALTLNEIHLHRSLSKPYEIILEDAVKRNRFSDLTGNIAALHQEITYRVESKLGFAPAGKPRVEIDKYWESVEVERKIIEEEISPVLWNVLSLTNGVLIASILTDVGTNESGVAARIKALTPIYDKLLNGAGCTDTNITKSEVESIALLYRTRVDRVEEYWPRITGREHDLAYVQLKSAYLLSWTGSVLEANDDLDTQTFNSISEAFVYCQALMNADSEEFPKLCAILNPKRIRDNSSDPKALRYHLGFLMFTGNILADEHWNVDFFKSIPEMILENSTAYSVAIRLRELFSFGLSDALNRNIEGFISRVCNTHHSLLVKRLITNDQLQDQHSLAEAINLTSVKVLKIFDAWIDKEVELKFSKSPDLNVHRNLHAVVSKSPATFFAPVAAAICTSFNVDMWREQRLSHIVIFDQHERSLAGMCYMYIERLPNIHKDKPTLIIRAINPMLEYVTNHDANSIVDSIISMGIEIARDNDFAAVCLPEDLGCELVSNRSEIHAAIISRFKQRDKKKVGQPPKNKELYYPVHVNAHFDAFEIGGGKRVSSLYVFWRCDLAE